MNDQQERAALAATPAPAPIGYLTRFKVEVEQQRQQFPGEEPDYLWRYTHGTKDLTTWEADDRQEVVRLYGQPTAEARAALAATPAQAREAALECERCAMPPEMHDHTHWCDNQSFRPTSCVAPAQAQQAEPVALPPIARRRVFDAIAGAYDLGYADRKAGRIGAAKEVEIDHGGALIAALERALAATPAPAPAAPLRDAQEQPFEDWWEREGQFCRAGGGAYEKTFAWNAWCAALAATPAPEPQWVPVSKRMPDANRKVLATYTNELGNRRTIVARWTPAKTVEADPDDDEGVAEYDEATDTYYLCEGWWEAINNWGDYSQVFVNEGKVDHWMPLPAAPAPQWTPEAVARTLALAEELRDKIKAKPDDEAGQGKEASNA